MKILRYTLCILFLFTCSLADAQNKVGIGAHSPEMKLHISEADSTVLLLENSNPLMKNVSNGLYFKTGNSAFPYTGAMKTIGTSGAAARMGLFTSANSQVSGLKERMSITDGGFVGIGNTSPERNLHITDVREELLLLENAADLEEGATSAMVFKTGRGTRSYTGAIKTIGKSPTEARLGLFTSAAVTSQGLQERLSILDNGDVGIGTVSPSSRLHIAQQSNKLFTLQNEMPLSEGISSNIEFKIGSGSLKYHVGAIRAIGESLHSTRLGFFTFSSISEGNLIERMSITDGGYVGMGVANPLSKLHISDTNEDLMILENKNSLGVDSETAMFFRNGSSGNSYTGAIKTIGVNTGAARLGFFTYAVPDKDDLKERLSISDNGNVGIGTTEPTAKLHVEGTLMIEDGSQGEGKVLTSDADGKGTWVTPNVCSLSIGDTYEGGIIFYLDGSGCHGLVVSDIDFDYGTWATNAVATDAVGIGLFEGQHNTKKILSSTGAGFTRAAYICDSAIWNGKTDWYLPSRIELDMIYLNLHKQAKGNFKNEFYWTSSEANALTVWTQDFANGNQDGLLPFNKTATSCNVRGIRKF